MNLTEAVKYWLGSSHAGLGERQPHLAQAHKTSDNLDDSFNARSLEKVAQYEFLRDYLLLYSRC